MAAAGRAAGGASRLLAGAVLLLVPVAVLLGRDGRPDAPGPVAASGVPMRIDALALGLAGGPDRFVDSESGRTVVPALPAGGEMGGVAWSPWRDPGGRTQLVGLWTARSVQGAGEQSLLRVSQPDGAVLDSLPLAGLPNWSGPPCWSPDRPGRLLLAGDDGVLYRLDYGGPGAPTPSPRPVPWPVGGSVPRVARLRDIAWPAGPRLGGRTVLASVCPAGVGPGGHRPDEWSIWWLRLDPDCVTVMAAGPLARRGSPGPWEERFPVLLSAEDPGPLLAWLERGGGRAGDPWRLRVAPFDVDPRSGDLSVRVESARTLAEDCAAAAPAFSADGRWIAYVPIPSGPVPSRLRRLPLAEGSGSPRAAVLPVVVSPGGRGRGPAAGSPGA